MQTAKKHQPEGLDGALADLARLRQFSGSPSEFWTTFLAATARLIGARQAVLAVKKSVPIEVWQKMSQWTSPEPGDHLELLFNRQLLDLAENCARQGRVSRCLETSTEGATQAYAIATQLALEDVKEPCIVAYLATHSSEALAEEALLRLRLVADLPNSYQLNQTARTAKTAVETQTGGNPWWQRWLRQCQEKYGVAAGLIKTRFKVWAIVILVGMYGLLMPQFDYSIKAKFSLRSNDEAYISAPFNGMINEVAVRAGDEVKARQTLLSLDRKELEIEEASALADYVRFTRETANLRAADALAEMRLAQAQAEQANTRLMTARYRLSQAQVQAPFDGVVVEGDQKDRRGAAVKQGEVLFRIVRSDSLYALADVREREVHELKTNAVGIISFTSQPKLRFPIRVEQIRTSGIAQRTGTYFQVRCIYTGQQPGWWRPGMTGVTTIQAGRHNLVWKAAHSIWGLFQ